MNRKVVIVALVGAMVLTVTGLAWADQGYADCEGQCVGYPKRAHMPMLTAEQREEVKAKAAELHEQGASPEEVRAAIAEMLKEWDIQPGAGQGGQQAGAPRWGQQAGAPRWGQQAEAPRWGQQGPPPQWGQQQQGWRGQQGLHGQSAQRPGWQMMMQHLTPQQREEVKAKITELHEDGASAQEIREALGDMLEGWGIEPR